jgi:hypothetical protein
MSVKHQQPTDPDLRGVTAALLRASEAARRLAQQTGTPFIVRQPDALPAEPPPADHQPARPSESLGHDLASASPGR